MGQVLRINDDLLMDLTQIERILVNIRGKSNGIIYNNHTLAIDYPCWLVNSMITEYSAIVCLLCNVSDIRTIDFGAIQDILRSIVEKYADSLNFSCYGNKYSNYLWFLNKTSDKRYARTAKKAGQEYIIDEYNNKKNIDEYINEVTQKAESLRDKLKEFDEFSTYTRFDRNTRYLLLTTLGSEKAQKELIPPITLTFNKTLKLYDSRLSQIIHNNPTTKKMSNPDKACEIIRTLIYALYGSQYAFLHYYESNESLFRDNSFISIKNDINICIERLLDLANKVGEVHSDNTGVMLQWKWLW